MCGVRVRVYARVYGVGWGAGGCARPVEFTSCAVRFFRAPDKNAKDLSPVVRAILACGRRPTRRSNDFRAMPANVFIVRFVEVRR